MEPRNDFELTKSIVEMVTGVQIFAKNRKRTVVEARMICGVLLRELGHSLTQTGEFMDKDHTTIIHYERTLKGLLETDKRILKWYLRCREILVSEKQLVNLDEPIDYKAEVFRLKSQVELLKAENYMLNEERNEIIRQTSVSEDKRFLKIFKLIEEHTPVGRELIIERKIRKMFDD